jgi:hypothetical protein
MENDGYIIIRDAIKYPALRLRHLRKDSRVHSSTMWKLRLETKKHFAKLWNTNDLVCSFDGRTLDTNSFVLPWHVDQNSTHENSLTCVQGVLALTHSKATQLLVGSHKYFESMSHRCTSNNPYEWESYEIPDNDYIWNKGLKVVTPNLNPGDLLIFDSRILHRVIEHKQRTVVYISMVPRKNVSNLIRRLRRKAYEKNYITTHWCEKLIVTDQDEPIQEYLLVNELV